MNRTLEGCDFLQPIVALLGDPDVQLPRVSNPHGSSSLPHTRLVAVAVAVAVSSVSSSRYRVNPYWYGFSARASPLFNHPSPMMKCAGLAVVLVLTLVTVPHAQTGANWIDAHRAAAQKLIAEAQRTDLAWQWLVELTDTFGPRLSGSEALERAIDCVRIPVDAAVRGG